MSRRIVGMLVLAIVLVLGLSAAAPLPVTTIRVVSGLPATMKIGESYPVVVAVTSNVPFTSAIAMPSDPFPGRGVVASGPVRTGAGTSATLTVMFTAKSLLVSRPDKQPATDIALVVVGVRYPGGYTFSQQFEFLVNVVAP